MKIKWYRNNEALTAGITLRDEAMLEANNMALHACRNPEEILHNRQQLATALNVKLQDFVCAEQTHSTNGYEVTSTDKGRGARTMTDAIPNTDALYTAEPNMMLCTFSADCVPVLFHHEKTGIIGVIHSGWQGTVKEITPHVFQHLIEERHCDPTYFHVQIGMAISQEKFEVDGDVYEKFARLTYADDHMFYRKQTGKYHIDNRQVVKKQCERMGIPSSQIVVDEACTYASTEGFSYRKNKQAGRHLAFIMKK